MLCIAVALVAACSTTYALGVGMFERATVIVPPQPMAAATVLPAPIKVTQPPATVSKPVNVDRILTEASSLTPSGIPKAALDAYKNATRWANGQGCQMPWQILAGIGLIESNHGRAQHNTLTVQGISMPGIFGPALNGQNGFALIRDDNGDFARAEGPMQFIPSTWAVVARSATGKTPNPQNINDAALSAAAYLCHGGRNLSTSGGVLSAIFSYNHSNNYVNAVLAVMRAYGDSNVPAPLPPDPSASASASPSASASGAATAAAKPTKSTAPTGTKGTAGGTTKPTGGTSGTPQPTGTPTPTHSPTPSPTPTPKPTCNVVLGIRLC
ncbi:hypothetical protein Back2_20550 [Nocardioides baekrokdamisoli]|uniref:Transglycosylase SLT domain-containing protein n=1 Tax=Nocardioides baekrokdamisoli TaxID=1804624 RepID=A0A3G9J2G0_9ACTN|nr:hypothetical protein Back2_20550 [Nocardioides baekrokdamisoli]